MPGRQPRLVSYSQLTTRVQRRVDCFLSEIHGESFRTIVPETAGLSSVPGPETLATIEGPSPVGRAD
jgi:hypothetical protein